MKPSETIIVNRKIIDQLEELKADNKRLKEKVAIAIKALEDIRVRSQRDWDEYDCCVCAIKAKTDIEEVK